MFEPEATFASEDWCIGLVYFWLSVHLIFNVLVC